MDVAPLNHCGEVVHPASYNLWKASLFKDYRRFGDFCIFESLGRIRGEVVCCQASDLMSRVAGISTSSTLTEAVYHLAVNELGLHAF